MSLRITIIENDPAIRAQIRSAIPAGMEISAEFAQLPGAAELRASRPDVICLGEQAARAADRGGGEPALSDSKLICLVSTATTHAVDCALSAGAFGCVLNAGISQEIARAIKVVADGGYFASPPLASLVATRYRDRLLGGERAGGTDAESAPIDRAAYSIERRPDGFSTAFTGAVCDGDMERWRADLEADASGSGAPFGLLLDFRDAAPLARAQGGVLFLELQALKARGLRRCALILGGQAQTSRLRRTVQVLGAGDWALCIDASGGLDWQKKAVEWVRGEIAPGAAPQH